MIISGLINIDKSDGGALFYFSMSPVELQGHTGQKIVLKFSVLGH